MKKRVSIWIGALCVGIGMLFACQSAPGREDVFGTDSLAPLQALKASAAYTKPPAEMMTSASGETETEAPAETTRAPVEITLPESTAAPPVVVESPAETTPVTTAAVTAKETEKQTVSTQTTVAATESAAPPETPPPTEDSGSAAERDSETSGLPETTAGPESETTTAGQVDSPSEPAEEQYLDFDKLRAVNPDIYAWIEIAGTIIDEPILQSATDSTKYLNTAYDGSRSTAGAIYTEATYNGTDFNDPVTLIYGHKTIAGHMFGALQSTYSDPASFVKYSDIKIYLPGEVRHYTVFAAVPYDSIHILYTYDFRNAYWYKNFFKNVQKIRAIGANFNLDIFPEPEDRVIILSTCLEGDKTRRYLVMAVLRDDIINY